MTVIKTRAGRNRVFDGRPHRLDAALALADVEASKGFTRLSGRAAPYEVFTPRWYYHLAIAPGAFDKTLSEHGQGLPLLLFHDSGAFPIGKALEWDATGDGLDGVWELDSSPRAQEAARQAAAGMMTGLSVGITSLLSDWQYTDHADWNPDDMSTWDKVTALEVRMDETSLTPTPGFQQARVQQTLNRPRHADRPGYSTAAAWLDSIRP